MRKFKVSLTFSERMSHTVERTQEDYWKEQVCDEWQFETEEDGNRFRHTLETAMTLVALLWKGKPQ